MMLKRKTEIINYENELILGIAQNLLFISVSSFQN